MNNNGLIKGILIALLVVYVVSPLDLAPGPVDDLLMVLFSVIINQRKSGHTAEIPDTIESSWRDPSAQ